MGMRTNSALFVALPKGVVGFLLTFWNGDGYVGVF